MKILFCNYEYPPLGGGGGVLTTLLAEEMAKQHAVTVLTSRAFDLPANEVVNGVKIVRVPVLFRKSNSVGSLPSLLSYIPMAIHTGKTLVRSTRFDVINSHFVLPTGPVGDALSRYAGVPNVLTALGGDLYDPSKWLSPHRHLVFRMWIRMLIRRADRIVGDSEDTVANVGKYYTNEVQPLSISLGIRRPPNDVAQRGDHGFEPDDVLFVTVGRLVARKAVDQLVHLMDALRDTGAHLLIVGSGPQEESLRSLVHAEGLEEQVRFMGRVSDAEKFRLLRMSDVYVSTSQHEGFGIVFLEAMACGLPIICYNRGGQTDFLVDGDTGYLVTLNDLKDFERRCRELVEDHELRKRLSDFNVQAMNHYYIDRTAREYEQVFEDAIAAQTERSVGYSYRL